MKSKHLNICVFLLSILIFWNCDVVDNNDITGSGNLITLEEDFKDFTIVKTGFAFESVIVRDSEFSIRITIDDNLEEYLNVYKLNNTLYVRMEDNNYQDVELKVEITMPDIEKIDLSGASACTLTGFNLTHDIELLLSGASTLNGNLNTQNINIELSGASNVLLSGNGTNLLVDGSGASVIDLGAFKLSENANVILSGASVSTVNLNGTLTAELSGASVLKYYGEPTLGTITLTGASTIQQIL